LRLAIFGGTFDPIHAAHLAVARAAVENCRLDKVLFVPAEHPPHKAGVTHAPYRDRVRMLELACAGELKFEVSLLEQNTSRSYSIDTIGKVRHTMAPGDELYFIIGSDAFAEIRNWHRWEEVARAVCFVVVSRPGRHYEVPAGVGIVRLDTVDLPVSSSSVRAALARGESPAEVPPPVLEYIRHHGLYRT
jgi:nicotinate-nucleotide adenylyltransferase